MIIFQRMFREHSLHTTGHMSVPVTEARPPLPSEDEHKRLCSDRKLPVKTLKKLETLKRKSSAATQAGQLTRKEQRVVGTVGWDVFLRYFANAATPFDFTQPSSEHTKPGKRLGAVILASQVAFCAVVQSFVSASDVWLALWSEETEKRRFPSEGNTFWPDFIQQNMVAMHSAFDWWFFLTPFLSNPQWTLTRCTPQLFQSSN